MLSAIAGSAIAMNDSDKIRFVVARFFNVAESALTDSYVFPPERLQSSVARSTLHAALKRMAGADLSAAFTANTYGELIATGTSTRESSPQAATPAIPAPPPATLAGTTASAPSAVKAEASVAAAPATGASPGDAPGSAAGVGIDIENVDDQPWSGDPWAEPFYNENFTGAEIAYCSRQADPRRSLCGLWTAKEAVLKCAGVNGLQPKDVEILHDPSGRPGVRALPGLPAEKEGNLVLSISHAKMFCVAVCLRVPPPAQAGPTRNAAPAEEQDRTGRRFVFPGHPLLWFGLGLALATGLIELGRLMSR
jgi:phosphopantetheine--protein transferase-like protein